MRKLFACASEQKSPAGAKTNTRERGARPVHTAVRVAVLDIVYLLRVVTDSSSAHPEESQ